MAIILSQGLDIRSTEAVDQRFTSSNLLSGSLDQFNSYIGLVAYQTADVTSGLDAGLYILTNPLDTTMTSSWTAVGSGTGGGGTTVTANTGGGTSNDALVSVTIGNTSYDISGMQVGDGAPTSNTTAPTGTTYFDRITCRVWVAENTGTWVPGSRQNWRFTGTSLSSWTIQSSYLPAGITEFIITAGDGITIVNSSGTILGEFEYHPSSPVTLYMLEIAAQGDGSGLVTTDLSTETGWVQLPAAGSGSGGGVSGTAGTIPVFDSSTDGVGDSFLTQTSVTVDNTITVNYEAFVAPVAGFVVVTFTDTSILQVTDFITGIPGLNTAEVTRIDSPTTAQLQTFTTGLSPFNVPAGTGSIVRGSTTTNTLITAANLEIAGSVELSGVTTTGDRVTRVLGLDANDNVVETTTDDTYLIAIGNGSRVVTFANETTIAIQPGGFWRVTVPAADYNAIPLGAEVALGARAGFVDNKRVNNELEIDLRNSIATGTEVIAAGGTLTFVWDNITLVDGDAVVNDDLFVLGSLTSENEIQAGTGYIKGMFTATGGVNLSGLATSGNASSSNPHIAVADDGTLFRTTISGSGGITGIDAEATETFTVLTDDESSADIDQITFIVNGTPNEAAATRFFDRLPDSGAVTVTINGISTVFNNVVFFNNTNINLGFVTYNKNTTGTVTPALVDHLTTPVPLTQTGISTGITQINGGTNIDLTEAEGILTVNSNILTHEHIGADVAGVTVDIMPDPLQFTGTTSLLGFDNRYVIGGVFTASDIARIRLGSIMGVDDGNAGFDLYRVIEIQTNNTFIIVPITPGVVGPESIDFTIGTAVRFTSFDSTPISELVTIEDLAVNERLSVGNSIWVEDNIDTDNIYVHGNLQLFDNFITPTAERIAGDPDTVRPIGVDEDGTISIDNNLIPDWNPAKGYEIGNEVNFQNGIWKRRTSAVAVVTDPFVTLTDLGTFVYTRNNALYGPTPNSGLGLFISFTVDTAIEPNETYTFTLASTRGNSEISLTTPAVIPLDINANVTDLIVQSTSRQWLIRIFDANGNLFPGLTIESIGGIQNTGADTAAELLAVLPAGIEGVHGESSIQQGSGRGNIIPPLDPNWETLTVTSFDENRWDAFTNDDVAFEVLADENAGLNNDRSDPSRIRQTGSVEEIIYLPTEAVVFEPATTTHLFTFEDITVANLFKSTQNGYTDRYYVSTVSGVQARAILQVLEGTEIGSNTVPATTDLQVRTKAISLSNDAEKLIVGKESTDIVGLTDLPPNRTLQLGLLRDIRIVDEDSEDIDSEVRFTATYTTDEPSVPLAVENIDPENNSIELVGVVGFSLRRLPYTFTDAVRNANADPTTEATITIARADLIAAYNNEFDSIVNIGVHYARITVDGSSIYLYSASGVQAGGDLVYHIINYNGIHPTGRNQIIQGLGSIHVIENVREYLPVDRRQRDGLNSLLLENIVDYTFSDGDPMIDGTPFTLNPVSDISDRLTHFDVNADDGNTFFADGLVVFDFTPVDGVINTTTAFVRSQASFITDGVIGDFQLGDEFYTAPDSTPLNALTAATTAGRVTVTNLTRVEITSGVFGVEVSVRLDNEQALLDILGIASSSTTHQLSRHRLNRNLYGLLAPTRTLLSSVNTDTFLGTTITDINNLKRLNFHSHGEALDAYNSIILSGGDFSQNGIKAEYEITSFAPPTGTQAFVALPTDTSTETNIAAINSGVRFQLALGETAQLEVFNSSVILTFSSREVFLAFEAARPYSGPLTVIIGNTVVTFRDASGLSPGTGQTDHLFYNRNLGINTSDGTLANIPATGLALINSGTTSITFNVPEDEGAYYSRKTDATQINTAVAGDQTFRFQDGSSTVSDVNETIPAQVTPTELTNFSLGTFEEVVTVGNQLRGVSIPEFETGQTGFRVYAYNHATSQWAWVAQSTNTVTNNTNISFDREIGVVDGTNEAMVRSVTAGIDRLFIEVDPASGASITFRNIHYLTAGIFPSYATTVNVISSGHATVAAARIQAQIDWDGIINP